MCYVHNLQKWPPPPSKFFTAYTCEVFIFKESTMSCEEMWELKLIMDYVTKAKILTLK